MMWRCDLQESTGAIQEAYSDLEGGPVDRGLQAESEPSFVGGGGPSGGRFFLWPTIANLALW
jgi:hypothetical protein